MRKCGDREPEPDIHLGQRIENLTAFTTEDTEDTEENRNLSKSLTRYQAGGTGNTIPTPTLSLKGGS